MDVLSKDALWQIVADVPTEMVEISDAYGRKVGHIKMRGLTGAELTEYQNGLTVRTKDGRTRTNMRRAMAKLVLLSAINDDGSPYFEESDLLKIDSMPAATLMPLFEAAQKLCGLSDDDVKEMKEDFSPTMSEHSISD